MDEIFQVGLANLERAEDLLRYARVLREKGEYEAAQIQALEGIGWALVELAARTGHD